MTRPYQPYSYRIRSSCPLVWLLFQLIPIRFTLSSLCLCRPLPLRHQSPLRFYSPLLSFGCHFFQRLHHAISCLYFHMSYAHSYPYFLPHVFHTLIIFFFLTHVLHALLSLFSPSCLTHTVLFVSFSLMSDTHSYVVHFLLYPFVLISSLIDSKGSVLRTFRHVLKAHVNDDFRVQNQPDTAPSMLSVAGAASALSSVLSSSDKSADPSHETLLTILHQLGRFRFGRGEGEPSYEVCGQTPQRAFGSGTVLG